MLRGSKPGERRGGRKRDTPNRRTILADRILAIGLEHPAASWRAFLLKLAKDRGLPAETRMAMAPRCFPPKRRRLARAGRSAAAGRQSSVAQEALAAAGSPVMSNGSQTRATGPAIGDWNPDALGALLGVVQDAAVDPQTRRKAALKIAEFLVPKVPKKAKTLTDEYGFRVSAKLASAYCDMQLRLRALVNEPTRIVPANAAKIKKLEARSDAIRRWLEVPCPTKYGNKEVAKDYVRLLEFSALRDEKTKLTEAQAAEEAHLQVRYDVFKAGPEFVRRCRLKTLENAEWRFRKS